MIIAAREAAAAAGAAARAEAVAAVGALARARAAAKAKAGTVVGAMGATDQTVRLNVWCATATPIYFTYLTYFPVTGTEPPC